MPYFIDQRWSSEPEPELGAGIITEVNSSQIKILFKKANLLRMYSAKNAPLKRVKFNIEDKVSLSNTEKFTVKNIKEENHILSYLNENNDWISEKDIGDDIPSLSILERLVNGDWNNSQEYNLRNTALELTNKTDHNPNRGLIGNRIELIPHQIYIAREISSRHKVRVLLADEMGLGKTIEACLILNRLLSLEIVGRALIIVPEPLMLQWFVELYRKFNLTFTIFEPSKFSSASPDDETNPFSDSQLFIASHNLLSDSKSLKQSFKENWDLLIIDEVHHIEINDNNKELQNFINQANHLILITATPTEFGEKEHFQRLNALDIDRFHNFSSYLKEKKIFPKIGRIAQKLLNQETLSQEDTNSLSEILGWNNMDVTDFINSNGTIALFQRLLDWHGTSRVFFKNSRQNIKGFPKRVFHPHPIPFNQSQSSLKEQNDILKLKVKWLSSFIKELNGKKILLICHLKETAVSLAKALKGRLTFNIAIFHEDLTLLERDKNAAWFSEDSGPQILIASEIGSEGRNFQFAHHLILWDLPESLGLIEQRIGRLDRIGQKETVNIHFPYIKNSNEHYYMNWLNDGINLFEKNFSGIDFIETKLLKEAIKISNDKSLESMIELTIRTKELKKQLETQLQAGKDFLLEKNSYDEKKGTLWADEINRETNDDLLEKFMLGYWEKIGVNIEPLEKKLYLLKTMLANPDALPGKTPEIFEVTFCRKLALKREEMFFLTQDHPMVTFALDYLLTSPMGQTRFVYSKALKEKNFYLEAIYRLKCPANYLKALGSIILSNKIKVTIDSKLKLINNDIDLYNPDDLIPIPDIHKEKFLSMFNKAIIKLFNEAQYQAEIISIKNKEESINKLHSAESIELERLSNLYGHEENGYKEASLMLKNNFNNMKEKINKSSISLDSLSIIIQT